MWSAVETHGVWWEDDGGCSTGHASTLLESGGSVLIVTTLSIKLCVDIVSSSNQWQSLRERHSTSISTTIRTTGEPHLTDHWWCVIHTDPLQEVMLYSQLLDLRLLLFVSLRKQKLIGRADACQSQEVWNVLSDLLILLFRVPPPTQRYT